MQDYYVTFRSVTYAQRGERVLKNNGIPARIQRSPRSMEERGCGYSLSLRQRELGEALALLRQAQVPYRKVYVRNPNGTLEEVML